MIAQAISDALARIAQRAADVRGLYQAGFEPRDPMTRRVQAPLPANDPLSVVAPADTFFVTAGPHGERNYGRDGSFVVADGSLLSRDGRAVLGYGPGGELRPLRAGVIDVATEQVHDPRIDADGTFAYERRTIEPRTGEARVERVTAGRLALARFPAGTSGDALRNAIPMLGRPSDDAFGPLTTFARDRGTVDPIAALERLQEAYVSLEAIRAAGFANDAVERTAMDVVK